jgi:hypothetical protein
MLQGVSFIALGIVFIVANANTVSSPYKEISGRVQILYVHTIDGRYDSTFLKINSDPQDLFIFDKNALHPAWNERFYQGEEIDIHYLDKTPKKIVAFQFYDQYGNPLTFYTTSDYQPQQLNPSVIKVGFVIGAALSIIGLLMLGFALYNNINDRRKKLPNSAAMV